EAVGPPSRIDLQRATRPREPAIATLAVVTWNTHVGAGDLDALTADLRSSRLTDGRPFGPFVLLLQEAYRAGDGVPVRPRAGARWAASAQPPAFSASGRDEIVTTATRLRLNAVYVPSMR